MNIYFAGSKGKTGSIIYNYLKEKGYLISGEINLNEEKLENIIKDNSIVIDFTNKDTALNHALICLNSKSHFICGTTGIEETKIKELQNKAKEKNLTFIFNPNFSLGIPKLLKVLTDLKTDFPQTKIVESHHISKLDLPSGTALLLKKELYDTTQIESIRTPYKSLDHEITLENEYETIAVTHKVKDKLAYAKGVEKELFNLINKK